VKVVKAIYNFFVGDMIILIGILIVTALLALIKNIDALAPLRIVSGPLLVVAVLGVLSATLIREARGKR
jgi:hypothetical protein